MKWAHLPTAGGLFDQDPVLIDRFTFIFAEQAKEQERQRKADENKRNAEMGKSGRRGASRPRR